jgi:AbrB family looped-hinge helix DNA binding protein
MKAIASISSRVQITIPVEVRRQIGLVEGEQVEFQVEAGVTTLRRFVNDSNLFARWAGRLGGLTNLQDSVDWQRDLSSDH